MQRKHLTKGRGSFRNKLMVACALVMAAILATPAAIARDHYRHGGDDTAKVVGALVVGAVIGGVLASSSHRDNYYSGGNYYTAQPNQSNYYGGYQAY
jgi:hypothetical protein